MTYNGDANLQQFVNKWDTILAELEVDKIGAPTLARMFENKLMSSKLLETEVRHFRRLPAGHADKTYQWLRNMADKILQLEKEDKNQAALQASHRAPVGSYSNAAAQGNDGNRGGDKKKGKGKGKNRNEGCKGRGGDSDESSDLSAPKDENATKDIPCKFLYLFDNCKFGKDCKYAHRAPTADEIEKYGFKKTGGSNPSSPGSVPNKDKPCFAHGQGVRKYGADCTFSHDPAVLAKAKAAKAKSKGKGKTRGNPSTPDSE